MALTLFAGAASAGSLTIQWDVNAEPDVVGYRVYFGTQPGVYASSVDVGNVTSYVLPNTIDGKLYCFVVAAYSAGPQVGARSREVCTDEQVNQPPTLDHPGDQSSQTGVPTNLTLVGVDPEGNPVTYTATGLPGGLVANKNTGFVSGTPTAAGTFNIQATVSDGTLKTSRAFKWTVSASAPGAVTPLRPSGALATPTATFEWESVPTATSYRLWIDDAGAADRNIDLTPAQAGCATAGAICHVSPGVALAAGRGSWSARASNATGAGPWGGALDFVVGGDNRPPSISVVLPASGKAYSTAAATVVVSGTASDDTAVTQVTWSNSRGGSGVATGTKSWSATAIPLVAGSNVLTVTARDAAGNTAIDTLNVTREDNPPVLKITGPAAAVRRSTTADSVAVTGTAKDDSGSFSIRWSNDRGGSGRQDGTSNWVIADVSLRVGVNVITVHAIDENNNRTTDSITITRVAEPKPSIEITSPTPAARYRNNDNAVALAGTAGPASIVAVRWSTDDGRSGVAKGTTNWRIPKVGTPRGVTIITVTAVTADGKTASESLTVTRASEMPKLSLRVPTEASQWTQDERILALQGIATDNVVRLGWSSDAGDSGIARGTDNWSISGIRLVKGVNKITLTAYDLDGRTDRQVLTVTYRPR
jgi:hypothetical protein